MATKREVAAQGTTISRSAQIALSDITLDDILAAATTVGAPTSARVSTSNTGYNPNEGQETLVYNVSFTWTDSV